MCCTACASALAHIPWAKLQLPNISTDKQNPPAGGGGGEEEHLGTMWHLLYFPNQHPSCKLSY